MSLTHMDSRAKKTPNSYSRAPLHPLYNLQTLLQYSDFYPGQTEEVFTADNILVSPNLSSKAIHSCFRTLITGLNPRPFKLFTHEYPSLTCFETNFNILIKMQIHTRLLIFVIYVQKSRRIGQIHLSSNET